MVKSDNVVARNFSPTKLQCIISILLVISAPYALTFTPYEGTDQADAVRDASTHLVPMCAVQIALIFFGMLGATLTIAILIWKLGSKVKEACSWITPHLSMALCSLTIGWLFFPLWINSLHQARHNPDTADFDSLTLMPYNWLDVIWWIGSIAIIMLATLMLALILSELIYDFQRIDWKENAVTLIFLLIIPLIAIATF